MIWMKKNIYSKFMNPCVVKKINNKYFVIYSYCTGYYYLLSNYYLDNILYTQSQIYDIDADLWRICEHNAINPNTIKDLSVFNSPIVMGMMISNCCNLDCSYCIALHANSYSINNYLLDDMEEIVSRIQMSNVVGLLLSGGEPTLNMRLPVFIDKIAQGDFLCELDTNGVYLSKEICQLLKTKWVVPRISLDSIQEDIHNSVRGRFEETYQNVTQLLNNGVDFRINTVLHNFNKDCIFDLAEWISRNNIQKWHIYRLQEAYAPYSLHMNDIEANNILKLLKIKYKDKIDIICKFSLKKDGFASFMIDSEGTCFSTRGKEKIYFGNIFYENISEIWRRTPQQFKINHLNKFLYFKEKTV